MLKRTGYDEALIMKGCTHLALWCCALISLTFVAVWFSDVFTLACYSPSLGNRKNGYWACFYEAMGVGIFFACFRDSVRMIAHFDDDRQRVLLQKWRELEMLRTESQQALDSAKENVERLRGKVVEMMKARLQDYAQEVFVFMVPRLRGELERLGAGSQKGAPGTASAEFEDLLLRLVGLLRDILEDVEELANGMLLELAEEHPEAYEALLSEAPEREDPLLPWDSWLEQELPSLADRGPGPRGTMRRRSSSTGWPRDAEPATSGAASPRCSIAAGMSVAAAALTARRSTTLPVPTLGRRENSDRFEQAVARSVMQPVEELLATPDRFAHRFESLMRKSQPDSVKRGQRMGWGAPPWEQEGCCQSLGCQCCVPRFTAVIGSFFCAACCFCCCPGLCSEPNSCIRKGFQYSPKRLKIGCLWVQIHTKLHERLLQGVLFSMAYCAFYASIVFAAWEDFSSVCKRVDSMAVFKTCVLGLLRKCVGFIALVVYIPAMCICIYHIDRLDAVMETMQTIWELEDVQKAIRAFHRNMAEVEEQVVLLRAIQGRVLARIDLVMQYGRKMATPNLVDGQLQSDMASLIEKLEVAAYHLRPASEWLKLSGDAQEACVRIAAESLDPTRRTTSSLMEPGDAAVRPSLNNVPLMDTGTFVMEEPGDAAARPSLQNVPLMDTGTFVMEETPGTAAR